jgi:hypothetical protein
MFIVDVQNIQTSLDLKANSIVPTIPCLQHAHLSAGFLSGRLAHRLTGSVGVGIPPKVASKGSITAFHECVVSETFVRLRGYEIRNQVFV